MSPRPFWVREGFKVSLGNLEKARFKGGCKRGEGWDMVGGPPSAWNLYGFRLNPWDH